MELPEGRAGSQPDPGPPRMHLCSACCVQSWSSPISLEDHPHGTELESEALRRGAENPAGFQPVTEPHLRFLGSQLTPETRHIYSANAFSPLREGVASPSLDEPSGAGKGLEVNPLSLLPMLKFCGP